ncbi:polyprenol phosphomannose-dependent alpha 1,6 mannosyltransferase MptB, partial [Streptomyces sp. NPDC026665]|uniref:polyprenol phosphomannose-dependent alpha 1,6 mannosyltransferase MptB n=1 Tax=Streptomyces sp. NPDC026665 TaxID=3154798 RepID=UPI0034066C1C
PSTAPAARGGGGVPAGRGRGPGRGGSARAPAPPVGGAPPPTAAATAVAGTGYGWIAALRTPVSPHNWSPTSVLGRATGALLQKLGSGLAPFALPAWHIVGLVATVGLVLFIWLRLRPHPVYALGLSLAAVAVFGPAIRPWYALWGLFLIAAAAPTGSVRGRVAAASAVLALAVLPSGSPADAGQVILAVSGGLLALVVLWQAHQTARQQAPGLERTA